MRFTGSGFAFLNQHWPLLAEALAPGGHFSVPLACTQEPLSLGILGAANVFVADQGGPAGGRNDGLCDGRDVPASVEATVTGLSVVARSPDQIELGLTIAIDTGKIYVTNPYAAFGFTCDLKCSFGYAAGTRAPPENALSLGVRLRIDTAWDRLLSFEVDSVGGTRICGAAGAGAPPGCLDPTDLSMSDEGSCPLFGWACDLLNVAAVKTFVLQQNLTGARGQPHVDAGRPALPAVHRRGLELSHLDRRESQGQRLYRRRLRGSTGWVRASFPRRGGPLGPRWPRCWGRCVLRCREQGDGRRRADVGHPGGRQASATGELRSTGGGARSGVGDPCRLRQRGESGAPVRPGAVGVRRPFRIGRCGRCIRPAASASRSTARARVSSTRGSSRQSSPQSGSSLVAMVETRR